jgi:hypothetical protein
MIFLSGATCDWGCKFNGDWLWIRMIFLSGATCDWSCKSLMVIGFESWWYFLVERHVIETVSLMVIDFASITCLFTKKYHPDSKAITIRLLQPQSHVAPLRNIILIQSQSPLNLQPQSHVAPMIFLSVTTREWGCKSLMVIAFESGWYFLVKRHVIEAVKV